MVRETLFQVLVHIRNFTALKAYPVRLMMPATLAKGAFNSLTGQLVQYNS